MLQSECDYVRSLCSGLKQERLVDLAKASRARAEQRRLETSVTDTRGCQTEFAKTVSRLGPISGKNYVFVYDLFAATQHRLPALPKTSVPPRGGGTVSEQDRKARESNENATAVIEVNAEIDGTKQPGPPTGSDVVVSEQKPEVARSQGKLGGTPSGAPVAEATFQTAPTVGPVQSGAPAKCDAVQNGSSPSVIGGPKTKQSKSTTNVTAGSLEASASLKPTETFNATTKSPDVKHSSSDSRVASKVTKPEVRIPTTNYVVVRQIFPEVRSTTPNTPIPQRAKTSNLDLDLAAIETASSSESSLAEVYAAVIQNDAARADDKTSRKKEAESGTSLTSSLLGKLKAAISKGSAPGPAASTQDPNNPPRAAPVEIPPVVSEPREEDVPQRSRHFISPSTTLESAVLKDPGLKHFQKRRSVSNSASRPLTPPNAKFPLSPSQQRQIATARPPPGAPLKAPALSTFPQPLVDSVTSSPQPPQRGVHNHPPPAKTADLGKSGTKTDMKSTTGLLLNSPDDMDSLSELVDEPVSDDDGHQSDSESEFHGSERNTAIAAHQKRIGGRASAIESAGVATNKPGSKTKKKKKHKKTNLQRRAESTRNVHVSSEEDSNGTTPQPKEKKLPDSISTSIHPGTSKESSTVTNDSTRTSPQSSGRRLERKRVSRGVSLSPIPSEASSQRATTTTADSVRLPESSKPQSSASTHNHSRGRGSWTQGPPDITSSETSWNEAGEDASKSRHFATDSETEDETSEGTKRSIFHDLSTAGYLPFDDAGTHTGAAVVLSSGRNYLSGRDSSPSYCTTGPLRSLLADGKNRHPSFWVQREAEDRALPFPRKIMQTLLPSFVDFQDSVRVDK